MMPGHADAPAIKSRRADGPLFQDIVESASDGIVVVDVDGHVIFCNQAFTQLFQRTADEFAGTLFGFPVVAGESTEIKVLRPDTSMVVAEMRVGQTCMGDRRAFVAILRDISQRVRADEQLRLSGKIFENTQEGIMVTDARGVILTVNPAFSAVTGYTAAEAIGQKPSLLNSGRHDHAFYDEMWRTLAEAGQWHGEIWNRRKNGDIYPEWIHMSAILDNDGMVSHYVAIFSDITKVKANEERLRALAHYDTLTGLPNRFLFKDHVELALAQAARHGKQVAIMFLDLDRFKEINDTLGHRAGDTVLIEVAGRLSGCLRAGDTLGRVGGDEFTAVLPGHDSAAAAAVVAGKFIEVLAHPFQIEGQQFTVTVSIGIAIFPQHGNLLEQLSHAADAAMYEVKQRGRNGYRFRSTDTDDDILTRRAELKTTSPASRRKTQGGAE
jgi:diguanylate cyclase (GGDEF)-like protein/PAS domain S-box-containing protein